MDYLKTREMYHHGIKGQKWGMRRYQNEDGTLTAEGHLRYGVDANGKMSREGARLYRQDSRSSLKDLRKDLKSMKLKTNYGLLSAEENSSRINSAKAYISENYGKDALKKYTNSETGKQLATIGVSTLASLGFVIGGSALWDHLKNK